MGGLSEKKRYCPECQAPLTFWAKALENLPVLLAFATFLATAYTLPILFNVDIAFLAAILPTNWYAYVAITGVGFNVLIAVTVGYGIARVRRLYKAGRF